MIYISESIEGLILRYRPSMGSPWLNQVYIFDSQNKFTKEMHANAYAKITWNPSSVIDAINNGLFEVIDCLKKDEIVNDYELY